MLFRSRHSCVGGYIAGSAKLVDMIRSLAPGFIFTTTMPPATMAGARAAIEYQYSYQGDRILQQLHTQQTKIRLAKKGIPVIPNPSHIVPILVGNAELAKRASDKLLEEHCIYVQAINYPTVPVGQERLRITPTPGHTPDLQMKLVDAVDQVWGELGIRRVEDWKQLGGLCGVGVVETEEKEGMVRNIWSDEQLRFVEKTTTIIPSKMAPSSSSSSSSSGKRAVIQQETTYVVDSVLENLNPRLAVVQCAA